MNRRIRRAGRRDFAQRARGNPFLLDHGALGQTVPVNPFANESELLERIDWKAERCTSVDAWWLARGREVFLQVQGQGRSPIGPRALAARWAHGQLYLIAEIDAPVVSRADFERVLAAFVGSDVFGRKRLRHTIGERLVRIGTLPPGG